MWLLLLVLVLVLVVGWTYHGETQELVGHRRSSPFTDETEFAVRNSADSIYPLGLWLAQAPAQQPPQQDGSQHPVHDASGRHRRPTGRRGCLRLEATCRRPACPGGGRPFARADCGAVELSFCATPRATQNQ